MAKGKLHEILAVEGDKEGLFKKILEETIVTFKKKPDLFTGSLRQYEPFEESEKDKVEALEERHEITTTVPDRLEYTLQSMKEYFDVMAQKELTNKQAKADIEIGDQCICVGLPATLLLSLENKLKTVRNIFDAMPTLPPGSEWKSDISEGENVWKLNPPEKKFRTSKTFKSKVLYEATKEHPAQIKEWEETENVGVFVTNRWNGMVTSADKASYLKRIDTLIQATKKARQRANCEPVVDVQIGDDIVNYIMSK